MQRSNRAGIIKPTAELYLVDVLDVLITSSHHGISSCTDKLLG
ncbi:hypothetical protein XBO1_1800009 [Xenorhabdus bovienii str. oregonense]|uniref:Uncharacterized protein n=1 Tax=Xenorhabdus bovienii str. oregonense TaxID=1398202 RepID=A0A077P397_XENBV|nr:hypothetical protein XBO1_1800009 [Xenorhabdus bovienii str. oregonense]